MVRTALFLALLAAGCADAASLGARLDKTTVALGEAITLTVEARGVELDAVDLRALGEHFELKGQTLSRGSDSATLVVSLYPRGTGVLAIPPLAAGGRRTAPLAVTVTDGSEAVPRVSLQWSLEPAAPFVNQPARLSLAICDDGSLQWQRPVLPSQAGRVLRALGETEDTARRDGAPCTLHRYDWALLPTREGGAQIPADMLDARRYGERLRFPGPAFAYRAQALPAWLPAHVPPVAPSVEADPWPARWPLDRPLAWRFVVTGGYGTDGLKALLDLQMRESPTFAVYPPLIETLAPAGPDSPLTRHAVTLFLQPRATGELVLPALRLPWFDPTRGELSARALPAMQLRVFDPRWQRAGEAGAALAGAGLLATLGWGARRMLSWRRARRRGLAAIRAAHDADTLAHAVRAFSLTGAAPAPSLGAWQQQLQRESGVDAAAAVARLERHGFGCEAHAVSALREDFLRVLAGARPRPAGAGGAQPARRATGRRDAPLA